MNTEQHKILNDFIGTMDELKVLLGVLPEKGLDWAEREGEWSIRQVIHHLADDGNVFTHAIERVLVSPGSKVRFDGYPGNDVWIEQLGYDQQAVDPSLDLMQAQHTFLSELLRRFPDRWQNKAFYYDELEKKAAEQSVAEIIIMLTEHMQEHIAMIKNIRQKHR